MTTTVPLPHPPCTVTRRHTAFSPEHILAHVRTYGYAENPGIARRQQRALTLLTQNHVTPLELTLTAASCPVVIRYRVQSESGSGHYYVTRTPNETTHVYTCTCPDTWQPCKHGYAATLYQTGLHLAHTHRRDLPSYPTVRASLPESPVLGAHELTALRVLLATATRYDEIAREAASQYYGAERSYASHCFSRLVDQTRWRYGTGYVGWSDGNAGELHSVAGNHVLAVHWHAEEVRWYIAGADGQEDVARTRRILDAALPHWLQAVLTPESDLPPSHSFEVEEEPDGHYHPGS